MVSKQISGSVIKTQFGSVNHFVWQGRSPKGTHAHILSQSISISIATNKKAAKHVFSNSSRPGGAHAVTELVQYVQLEPGHAGPRQTVSLSTAADKHDVI